MASGLINQGGQVLAVQGQPMLLVVDRAGRVQQISQLLQQADVPAATAHIEFISLQYITAEIITAQLESYFKSRKPSAEHATKSKREIASHQLGKYQSTGIDWQG